MTGGAEGERLMEKNYFWHVYSLQGLGRHTKQQDWWEIQSLIWERWGFLTISLYWDNITNALLSKCIWQIVWKNWFGLLRRFRVAFLSSLLLCTCVCVCVALFSSDWLCRVYSLSAPPRWAQSPCVTFDLTTVIKRRQDHFLLWTPTAQLAPATPLPLQHRQGAVIGVDSLNKKSLRYSSDFLIGRYSEGCR